MEMKWSRFVSFHEILEGKYRGNYIVFNSFNQAKILLPEKHKEAIERSLSRGDLDNQEIESVIAELLSMEMLVDDTLDEKEKYETIRKLSANFQDKAVFYFTPSFNCNFKCIYCIVEPTDHNLQKRAEFIDEVLIDQIAKWILDYTAKLEVNLIEIIFFGGEPTLGFDQNIELMELLYSYKAEDVRVVCSMISNGYIYDEKSIDRLKGYGLNGLQITLDGPAHIHNKRRITVDDQDTFATILENINQYLKFGLRINLRVNVDKENAPYLTELIDELKRENLQENLAFELSFVPVDPNDDKNIKGYDREALKWYPIFFKHAREQGFNNLAMWSTFCGIYSKHILGIGPKGELYHCPTYSGVESQVVGSIVTDEFNDLYDEYINADIPDKCKQCRWTGICGGGCVLVKHVLKDKYCLKETYDYIVSGYLRAKYDEKTIDHLIEQGEGERKKFEADFYQ